MELKPTEILNVGLDFGDGEILVGRLILRSNKVWFEYDAAFFERKMEISPFRLPLTRELVAAKYQPFEGLFGVFNDSLPDGWGKLLLDRALLAREISSRRLSPLDRLAYVGRSGMGALKYYPVADMGEEQEGQLDLNLLADEVDEVQSGVSSEILDELYGLGGSSAGARPKIVAGYNKDTRQIISGKTEMPAGYDHWLIKFPSSTDQPDIANIEFAYSEMARAAGIEMSETKLFEGSKGRMYFGTKRFDRQGGVVKHMHTVAGLLHSDFRTPSLDYEILMKCVLALCNNMEEAEKMFRLAAFNVFSHNRDDHGKNFSFLMDHSGKWSFAPAYDLTYSFGPGNEHSTTIMGEGRNPNRSHLILLAEKFGLKNHLEILDQVESVVNRWPEFAKDAQVTAASSKMVAKSLS